MASAKEVGQGDCFRVKNDIFRVVRKEVIAVGTHSHTKVKLIVVNIAGGGEKPMVYSHEDKLETLEVRRSKAQVVSKGNGVVQVMDNYTYETLDATVDPELYEQLKEGDIVATQDIEGRFSVTDKLREGMY